MAHTAQTSTLTQAYATCINIARAHYENFPVATFFLPYRQRISIAAIYAFARTADDFADSSSMPAAEKIASLQAFQYQLDHLEQYTCNNHGLVSDSVQQDNLIKEQHKTIFIALADTVKFHNLPVKLLHDLLLAFTQDVTTNRYYDFAEVLKYCELSANPVGQLLLHVANAATSDNIIYSNAICTGLQLINFMQDLHADAIDLNRCYIPLTDLTKYNLSVNDVKDKTNQNALVALIHEHLQKIHEIYRQGAPLALELNGVFGFYIRLIMSGGLQVLHALAARSEDPFARPVLTVHNWIKMILQVTSAKNKFLQYMSAPLAIPIPPASSAASGISTSPVDATVHKVSADAPIAESNINN